MSANINSVSHKTSSWNSWSLVKQGAIVLTVGAVTGYLAFFAGKHIGQICADDKSELGKYFCMKSRNFFDIDNLAKYTNPIVAINHRIAGMVEPLTSRLNWFYSFLGPVSFNPTNCNRLKDALGKVVNKYKNTNLAQDVNEFAISTVEGTYDPCCNYDNAGQALASSFAEELTSRLILQGILIPGLIKIVGYSLRKLQGGFSGINNNQSSHLNKSRVSKINKKPSGNLDELKEVGSYRYSSILVTSLIFAFLHVHPKGASDSVAPQFISSLILGMVFEKYGIFGSTASHFAANLFGYNFQKQQCFAGINEQLKGLSSLLNSRL